MKFKLIILSLIPWIGLSQYSTEEVNKIIEKSNEQQLVTESSRYLQEDYYYYAEAMIDKLLSIKPESSNYNYRKGFVLLYSKNDFQNAIKHFEIAKRKTQINYDMYSSKEDAAPTDVYYHLAKCYHIDEQIDKAVENYNLFIQNSSKKSELVNAAHLGLQQCEVAKSLMKTPRSNKVQNIDIPVNTEYPEYAPVISFDGKSLYFTSRRPWKNGETEDFRSPKTNQYPEDIYLSVAQPDKSWSKPERMSFCDPELNEATITVSVDERKIYVYQDISGGGDIFYSEFSKNKFQVLENIGIQGVNTKYWETHCAVTPDGKNIYFTSERPGGYGGRDIYRIVKLSDGSWSQPFNLGPKINTPNDEESPFILIDNKTMYFASNGPNSMGGFDIFVSVRDENNEWSDPINLGYPINSTGDDLFYTTTVNGQKGYLSSFRKGGKGEKDIYEIDNELTKIENVTILKGNIHTLGSITLDETAHVMLNCITCNEEPTRLELRPRDGAFITPLVPCSDYEITFMKNETEIISTEKFSSACNKSYEEIIKEVYLADYQLSGTVTDKSTSKPVEGVKIEIIDTKNPTINETLSTNKAGQFHSQLLNTKKYGDSINYEIKISAPGYLSITRNISDILKSNVAIQEKISIDMVDIGKDLVNMIEIHPIYFDLDKSDIRPDAQLELDKIVKIMNDNPTLRIELGSHTDCRADASYNLKLSERRAKSSAEYIKKRITNPSRIYGKGYGESKLINDCACEGKVESTCTDEQHQENRRTEFRIVK